MTRSTITHTLIAIVAAAVSAFFTRGITVSGTFGEPLRPVTIVKIDGRDYAATYEPCEGDSHEDEQGRCVDNKKFSVVYGRKGMVIGPIER